MLDSTQAKIVAYTTADGETWCAEHAESWYGDDIRAYIEKHKVKERGGYAFSVVDALEASGLSPLSRFDIDEVASAPTGYANMGITMPTVCDVDGEPL